MTQKSETEKKSKVPSSFSQMGSIVKFELLNYFRARRFYVLLSITVLISLLITAVVAYYRPVSYLNTQLDFYASWWGAADGIPLIIILSGIFFGGDAISGEFQNKTGYFLIPNPIRRSTIYVGKWLAALIASASIVAVYAAITIANGIYYFGTNLPYQFGESFLFALLYLISVLGFTFFFSSLFKSSSISILMTALLFLFIFTLLDRLVTSLAKTEPWFILTYGAGIIGNVLSGTYPDRITTVKFGPGPGFTTYNATIVEGLAIMIGYFLVTAVIGLILFERKELN